MDRKTDERLEEVERATRPNTDDELEEEEEEEDEEMKRPKPTKSAIRGPNDARSLRSKLDLCIPPTLVRRRLVQERFTSQTSMSSAVFLAAAVEGILMDILDVAIYIAKDKAKSDKPKLSAKHLLQAIKSEEELAQLFPNVLISLPPKPVIHGSTTFGKKKDDRKPNQPIPAATKKRGRPPAPASEPGNSQVY